MISSTIKIERACAASWTATMEIENGLTMRAWGRTARDAFEAFEALMEDAALEYWNSLTAAKEPNERQS